MAGLIVENYANVVDQEFLKDAGWTTTLSDQSGAIEGTVLNLAKAGARPQVLVNNMTYPLSLAAITDTASQITLDKMETVPTAVYNWQTIQFHYDKMASDMALHKEALLETAAARGAFNLCATTAAAGRPILQATGVAVAGRPTLTFKDVNRLQTEFNKANIPQRGRVLVLSADHKSDLFDADEKRLNQSADHVNGIIGRLYGFDLYESNQGAVYNSSTGAKQAFGAAEAAGFFRASFGYQTSCVLRAWKPTVGFATLNDPFHQADIISFNKYGLIIPRRTEGYGVIFS
jgi:hypothetical protein